MALETATHITDLINTNPTGADDRSTADDHLRLIKAVLLTDFANISGAVTASHTQLNKLTSTAGNGALDAFPTGTLVTFQQTAAPTGWTKETTHHNKALRVVTGTAGSGGSHFFSTVFGKSATDSTAITIAQMPAHTHTSTITSDGGGSNALQGTTSIGQSNPSSSTGGGAGHTHGMDIRVLYVDLIIASKD